MDSEPLQRPEVALNEAKQQFSQKMLKDSKFAAVVGKRLGIANQPLENVLCEPTRAAVDQTKIAAGVQATGRTTDHQPHSEHITLATIDRDTQTATPDASFLSDVVSTLPNEGSAEEITNKAMDAAQTIMNNWTEASNTLIEVVGKERLAPDPTRNNTLVLKSTYPL